MRIHNENKIRCGDVMTLHPEYDMSHYEALIEQFPHSALVHMIVAEAYRRGGMDKRALELYTAMLRMKPKLAVGYVNRALLYQEHGLNSCALKDIKRAAELDPKYEDAIRVLQKLIEGKRN